MTTKFPPSLSGISHTHTHTRSVRQFCSVNKFVYLYLFNQWSPTETKWAQSLCRVLYVCVCALLCVIWLPSNWKVCCVVKSGLHGVRSPVRNLAMQLFFWMHSVWEWDVMKWQTVVNNCNPENLLVPLFLSICWAQCYSSWWVLLEVESHKQMINSPKTQRKK